MQPTQRTARSAVSCTSRGVASDKRTITEHAGKHSNALAKLAGRLSGGTTGPTGRVDLDANVQRTAVSSTTTKQEIVRYDWHRLGGDAITVGPTGSHLQGPMITDFKGWRVTPYDAGRISGVIARVKVREQWINFENADIVRHPPGLLEKVKRLMNDHRRKQFFELLLRHLMMRTELRMHQEGTGTGATIASHVLLVRPYSERATSPFAGQSRRQVTIDGAQVAQWLAAEEGHEVSALIALGLHADVIGPSAEGEPFQVCRGQGYADGHGSRFAVQIAFDLDAFASQRCRGARQGPCRAVLVPKRKGPPTGLLR